jgi:carbamoyltransferase
LLADPRLDSKDHVNKIKRRQAYRPFAPAILAEHYDDYFDGPANEYMQFVSLAKHDHKSVTHIDGTARVQMVKPSCQSVLRPVLEEWYDQTGCPMLLNTSLNIRGMPMVNTWKDAKEFEREYQVKVF